MRCPDPVPLPPLWRKKSGGTGSPRIPPDLSYCSVLLFCVIRYSGFPDHIDLDLSRIFQLGLHLLRDFSGHQNHIVIADLFRYDHDTYLASCLDRKGLIHSLEGIGDILRITEGDLAPIPCLKDEINNCSRANECITLPFWQGLDKVIKDYVESVTIQDLIDHANMQVNNYSI